MMLRFLILSCYILSMTGYIEAAQTKQSQIPKIIKSKSAQRLNNVAEQGNGNPQVLYEQLEKLRNEVESLRNGFEQNANRLREIQEEHRQRYLELDNRIRRLTGDNSGATSSPNNHGGVLQDRAYKSYKSGYELLRDKDFDGAIKVFDQLLFDFPSSQYVADTLFWLGEIYLNIPIPDFEKSRQKFVQLVDFYPQHNRVPSAWFKLGQIYYQLDDPENGNEYLKNVISKYPKSTSARLAEKYLKDLQQ